MKQFIKSKKVIALLATSLVAVVAAVGAYSYFTTSGSGSGSATVGTATALTVTQTNTISGLVPGGGAKPVAFQIVNTVGNGVQNLGAVTISDWSVTPVGTNSCDETNFSVN